MRNPPATPPPPPEAPGLMPLALAWRVGPYIFPHLPPGQVEMEWHALGRVAEFGRDRWTYRRWYAWRHWGEPRGLEAGDVFGVVTVTAVERSATGELLGYSFSDGELEFDATLNNKGMNALP